MFICDFLCDLGVIEFQKFHVNRLIPEYEKNYPGWQLYLAQGLRGENQNKYGWIIIVESEEIRDKYYENLN